jgi:3-hydroxybutyryl-CoA dehydrogenase
MASLNRLQFALLRECLALVEDGVADAATVDLVVERGLAPRWVDA